MALHKDPWHQPILPHSQPALILLQGWSRACEGSSSPKGLPLSLPWKEAQPVLVSTTAAQAAGWRDICTADAKLSQTGQSWGSSSHLWQQHRLIIQEIPQLSFPRCSHSHSGEAPTVSQAAPSERGTDGPEPELALSESCQSPQTCPYWSFRAPSLLPAQMHSPSSPC